MKKTKTQKKEYVPPKVKVTLIEMEQGVGLQPDLRG